METQTALKKNKTSIIVAIVALVIIMIVWMTKNAEVRNERNQTTLREDSMRTSMKSEFLEWTTQTNSEYLKTVMMPLGWLMRTEMLTAKTADMNLYIEELVKRKGFQSILVTDENNRIIAATNKKMEGQMLDKAGLNINDSPGETVIEVKDNKYVVVSPILGFNKKMGLVIVNFNASAFDTTKK